MSLRAELKNEHAALAAPKPIIAPPVYSIVGDTCVTSLRSMTLVNLILVWSCEAGRVLDLKLGMHREMVAIDQV